MEKEKPDEMEMAEKKTQKGQEEKKAKKDGLIRVLIFYLLKTNDKIRDYIISQQQSL